MTTTLGLSIGLLLTIPALVCAFVAALALRNTQPEQRAEILHALAKFSSALLPRSGLLWGGGALRSPENSELSLASAELDEPQPPRESRQQPEAHGSTDRAHG
jgi:hypothetical protein